MDISPATNLACAGRRRKSQLRVHNPANPKSPGGACCSEQHLLISNVHLDPGSDTHPKLKIQVRGPVSRMCEKQCCLHGQTSPSPPPSGRCLPAAVGLQRRQLPSVVNQTLCRQEGARPPTHRPPQSTGTRPQHPESRGITLEGAPFERPGCPQQEPMPQKALRSKAKNANMFVICILTPTGIGGSVEDDSPV